MEKVIHYCVYVVVSILELAEENNKGKEDKQF